MTVISMISNDTPYLPPKVTDVPKDILRNFPHSKKVGNYLLGNTLGEGSFAKVKEALHIPTGERVAVKIIDKKRSREDSYVRKNLRREGKILQMIRHENVVQLLEIMETQNSYYLVTELCRGGDLMDYISQRRKLPETEVKKYIRQIVSSVDYLHRLGILHRDLKIENLLLDEFKDMKIIDFGLSNCVKVIQTKDGPRAQEFCVTQCGSPAYAAPELLGRKKYGPQVDIWSVGVNMYAMLTGNLPFTVEPFNIKALHNKMMNGQMNPLPDGISKDCRDIIKKFLNPDPDKRITVEDILKHPWIAEGPGVPLTRAICPNKLKTELLDNSILKHMSENQGFRIGEIIRYVTQNVPSSASAMYHLMLRKLTKHYGNLRATGKIPASDQRMLNRSQHVNNAFMKPKVDNNAPKSAQPYTSVARPLVNHTVNTVRNTVQNYNKIREHDNNQNGDANNNKDDVNLSDNEKPEDTDEAFIDILQTKGTNGAIHIPRASCSTKQKKESSAKPFVPTHLPNVANKYVVESSRRTTVAEINTQQIANDAKENKYNSKHIDKLSATETVDPSEEPFRKRASTFPGKMQRPKVSINKFIKEKTVQDQGERSESVATNRIMKSKQENNLAQSLQINVLTTNQNAQKTQKRVIPYQTDASSPTPRLNTHNSYHSSRKQTNQSRRILNANQTPKTQEKRDLSPGESINNDDDTGVTRHLMSRPVKNNRMTVSKVERAKPEKDELYLVEHISEISSSSTRPLSSRNTNISTSSNNSKPVTFGLPALLP